MIVVVVVVAAVVVVVVECYCFLINIIVGLPEPWLPLVLLSLIHI